MTKTRQLLMPSPWKSATFVKRLRWHAEMAGVEPLTITMLFKMFR